MNHDLQSIFTWWYLLFLLGICFLPLTVLFFSSFFDKGYIFAKILGMAILSYAVLLFGTIHILSFTRFHSILLFFLLALVNFFIFRRYRKRYAFSKANWKAIILEEVIFFVAFAYWSFVRAHQPDIHGLEKFMDFGFVNAILRSQYFPAYDMWFTPFSINYYYFGHLITAVLTKISDIPSAITFNLMIALLFALTFTASFSLGGNLVALLRKKSDKKPSLFRMFFLPGILSGALVSLAGNLHVLYAFFRPYSTDVVQPFWQLTFSPASFPNSYWYPNATRFIYHTIHEFPIYSFVVSDLHGHVLDIPFVLLTLALSFVVLLEKNITITRLILFSFLLPVMYMTNAWDGLIYILLILLVIVFQQWQKIKRATTEKTIQHPILLILAPKDIAKYTRFFHKHPLTDMVSSTVIYFVLLGIGFFIFSLPFSLFFKPFVAGIGVLCAPKSLTDIGHLGPFLFEANHCQSSPIWQLAILYGFFYFFVIVFIFFIWKRVRRTSDVFVILLIFLSTVLILVPEFIYAKDIYPDYYRANTMFKLVYQAFIMLSLSSSYIILRIFSELRTLKSNLQRILGGFFVLVTLLLLTLVFIYPVFAVSSYYGNLRTYQGLDGTTYLKTLYPSDYQTIQWLNKNVSEHPVILEAQGDSYTDYARISANTGLPTVLGWTVHEWLWRGSYSVPAPRIADVKTLYESTSIDETKQFLQKYNVTYVIIGTLEHQKYSNLDEAKFKKLGKVVFQSGTTTIYKVQ